MMGGVKLTITAFQVDFGDGPKEYLTCADIERLNKGRGIPVEALIGVDGENIENLEHEMRRGVYLRANFDMEYEEYEINTASIDQLDKDLMGYRRAQVLECNVRRSAFENASKVVGWTDEGYYIELLDGQEYVGHRAKVCLQDIRRSYAVADVILPGGPMPSRGLS